MTGWNLPPGVNESDIPGNRPEDILWEKESEIFCENCEDNKRCDHDINSCKRAHELKNTLKSYWIKF